MKILSVAPDHLYGEILELAENCQKEEDVRPTLNILARKVAEMMKTDVCSVYLVEPQSHEIVLVATHGLNPEAVGKIRMGFGEGLVGKTLEWVKPVSMARGSASKAFKYFPGSGEERYASFLSVPLLDKRRAVGAVVVQNEKATRFSHRSAQLLMTLMAPVAKIIARVKLVNSLGRADTDFKQLPPTDSSTIFMSAQRKQGVVHRGIAASPGIGIARLHCINNRVQRRRTDIPQSLNPEDEKKKVTAAIAHVREEMVRVRQKAERHLAEEELAIFEAYDVLLDNEHFLKELFTEIDNSKSAIQSIELVVNRYSGRMSEAEDPYLKERSYDIEDIGRKLVNSLISEGTTSSSPLQEIQEPHVLYSPFWSISDMIELDPAKVKGVLSASGGASSHIAILAESMGIPAVLGLGNIEDKLQSGHLVIMDGSSGLLITNPDDQTLEMYDNESQLLQKEEAIYRKHAQRPGAFKDGRRVVVGANLGMIAHLKSSLAMGAEEVGLYRTEFPFLIRKTLPTEEEQQVIYKRVIDGLGGKTICIRVLDLGGDKEIPYLNFPKEANPFLGWRSVRIFREREDLFRIQLRAIHKAASKGRAKLLIPMITSFEEVLWVKEVIQDVRRELKKEKTPCKKLPLGIMIEVPAAVEILDKLIEEVDFLSIGTNDLTQYLLAVDRNNPKVASLYDYLHPSVLRAIHKTAKIGTAHGKEVSVCGEMAGEVLGVIALLSLGVERVSMNAPLISKIKSLISQLSQREIKRLGKRLLNMETAAEVRDCLVQFLRKKKLEEYLPHKI